MAVLLVAPCAQGKEIARVLESSHIEVIRYEDPMRAVGSLTVCAYTSVILVIGQGCDPYVVASAFRAVEEAPPIPIILVSGATNPRMHRALSDTYSATRSINHRDIYGLPDMIFTQHAPVTMRLLLADDRDDIAIPFRTHLSPRFEVVHVTNGVAARDQATKGLGHWDLIVLDNSMPKMSGISCLAEIRKFDQETPIVLHSAYFDKPLVCRALETGANDTWAKNLKAGAVRSRVDRVISRALQSMERELYENV